MLLRTHNHAGAHKPHVCDDLIRDESMSIDQVGPYQTASSTKAGLAMNGNRFIPNGNHVMRQSYESFDHMQWWAGAVVKDHIEVVDAQGVEVGG